MRQRGQLGQARVRVGGAALGPNAHQHNAFQPKLSVFDFGDVFEFGGQPGDAAQRGAVSVLDTAAQLAVQLQQGRLARVFPGRARRTISLDREYAGVVPGSYALLLAGLGLVGLASVRRRR